MEQSVGQMQKTCYVYVKSVATLYETVKQASMTILFHWSKYLAVYIIFVIYKP